MKKLTSKQRAELKSVAQRLKPLFIIGAAEVHENVLKGIDDTFNNKELVKVKVNRVDKTDKTIVRRIADEIEKNIDVQVVAVIGTTIILYRQHQEEDKRILNG